MNDISTALINRLRISGPLPSEREVEETRMALREGLDLLAREGNIKPTLRALIWRLSQDAAETLHRLPDRERAWLMSCERSAWPELARASEECRAVEWEIAIEELAGVREQARAPMPRLQVTDPSATRRMLTVLGWLKNLRARTSARVKRDKMVFIALAQGRPYQFIRPMMGRNVTDFAILAVRGKVLLHLETTIKKMLTNYAEFVDMNAS